MSWLRRKEVKTRLPSQKKLLKSLDTIKDLSPRETILSAYDFLSGPSSALTELYISTVYSQKLVTNSESREALDMIYKVKNLIENYQKTSPR